MKLFPEGVGILFALCFFLAFLECSPTLPKTFLFSCDHSCYVISSLYSYHSLKIKSSKPTNTLAYEKNQVMKGHKTK